MHWPLLLVQHILITTRQDQLNMRYVSCRKLLMFFYLPRYPLAYNEAIHISPQMLVFLLVQLSNILPLFHN